MQDAILKSGPLRADLLPNLEWLAPNRDYINYSQMRRDLVSLLNLILTVALGRVGRIPPDLYLNGIVPRAAIYPVVVETESPA
jgi:hypothetical protein